MEKTLRHKKCKRLNIPGHAHELTFSCYRQQNFLNEDKIREYLANAIGRAREKHDFDIWAYVIMPDHVHLLIYPKAQGYSIAKILFSIKQPIARKAIPYLRKNHPDRLKHFATGQKNAPYRFWKPGGGYDRNITSIEILSQVVDYIHRNPIRQGLVTKPEEWFWSSYNEWAKPGTGPITVDRESFPLI
jgi:putative transposase